MAESKPSAEATLSDTRKRIRAAFKAFDYGSTNTVDVRDGEHKFDTVLDSGRARNIDTIVYSLGCFPTLADLRDLIAEVEENQSGYVHLDKFLPVMTDVLLESKFPPVSKDTLLQAFKVLDKEKKGYLEPEELTKYMTEEGEPFTQQEMDEMLAAHTDPEKKVIFYEDIISKLTLDPDK